MEINHGLEIINTDNNLNSHTSVSPKIPCCLCGTMIYANASNQCSTCLAQQFDLKSILQRGQGGAHEITIRQCRQCRKYETTKLSSSSISYQAFELEIPELLSLCLKRIPALQAPYKNNLVSNIHVTDAIWVWTEPNCMRLKVRVTVRATVGESQNTIIQQRCIVTFVVRFQQCHACNREYNNSTWHALVQLRQKANKTSSSRGLLMLENVIARHPTVRQHILQAVTVRQGFDFYFMSLAHAQTFTNFVTKVMPIKVKNTSRKLISSDPKNNTYNFRHTIGCELVPLCRHDLLLVSDTNKKAASKIVGNGNNNGIRLGLVTKVSKCVRLLDATYSNQKDLYTDLHPDNYWKYDKYIKVICAQRNWISFVVLNIEPILGKNNSKHNSNHMNSDDGTDNHLIEVEVARESDFGMNDIILRCTSHLGHLLNVGDTVAGYDLTTMVLPTDDETFYQNNTFDLPDVILVKKSKSVYGNNQQNNTSTTTNNETNITKTTTSRRKEKRKKKQQDKERRLEQTATQIGLVNDDIMEDEDDALLPIDEKKKYLQLDPEEDDYSDLEKEVHDYLKNYQTEESDVVDLMKDMEIATLSSPKEEEDIVCVAKMNESD